MTDFTGSFTALITPFTEDASSVDLDRLASNINHQSIAGVDGIVPCGTTGETPTLTDREYRAVVERSVEIARPIGLTVIPGAGSNSTSHAIEQHRFVCEVGAHAALHVAPYYNKPSQEGLYRHFMAIADSCDLPIVVYNIPGRTSVLIAIETLERLAEHPNIVAVKEATGSLDLARQIIERTDLTVLSGDDPLTLPLATLGGSGVISVVGNVLPDRVAALCHALLGGDWTKAREINDQLLPLARALLKLDTNPIPVKTAMKLLGRDSGVFRLPLCEPTDEVAETLRGLLIPYDLAVEAMV